jgi:hypothetical protein
MTRYTKEQCVRWLANQSVNPVTRGKVSVGTRTYYRLLKSCELNGLEPPFYASDKWRNPTFIGCQKWRHVKDPIKEFGTQRHTKCNVCRNFSEPYAVHNPFCLEFECPICDESVEIVYMCAPCTGCSHANEDDPLPSSIPN